VHLGDRFSRLTDRSRQMATPVLVLVVWVVYMQWIEIIKSLLLTDCLCIVHRLMASSVHTYAGCFLCTVPYLMWFVPRMHLAGSQLLSLGQIYRVVQNKVYCCVFISHRVRCTRAES